MRRLTQKTKDGKILQPITVSIAELITKLSQYEDTGLEPEQVKELLDQKHNPNDCVVKDGEWVAFKDQNGRYQKKCSICGAQVSRTAKYRSFCANCGARLTEAE